MSRVQQAAAVQTASRGTLYFLRVFSFRTPEDEEGKHGTGYTPLSLAALSGNVPVTRALLETHRADVGCRLKVANTTLGWSRGVTPLHMVAAFCPRERIDDIVKMLLDAGADPTLICKGKSTLYDAVVERDTRMVVLLLEAAGASRGGTSPPPMEYINFKARDGWSALGLAARVGDAAIVKALLDVGADRAAVMQSGKTALDIARLNRRAVVVSLLEAYED